MDRGANRAIVVRFVSRVLNWILLGRGRLRRRHTGDSGAACELVEMNVPERKGKLQRYRCKRDPRAPTPIAPNPTHQANCFPARTQYPGRTKQQSTARRCASNAIETKRSRRSPIARKLWRGCNRPISPKHTGASQPSVFVQRYNVALGGAIRKLPGRARKLRGAPLQTMERRGCPR
jgi:hypothetical protein